jgi:carbonic anhydrase
MADPIGKLLEANARWAAERIEREPDYFGKLAALQAPQYLWIGCSDGLAPGEVFVHRNVANLVHPADLNCLSVLQFAVEVLRVRHVIVCGHYGCGGVHAAMEGKQHGLIDNWLEPIRDVAAAHAPALAALDAGARADRLCELNVVAQARRVCETPIMQDAWRRGQALAVHGWVYGLNDGRLRDLGCTRSG